jgi:hypothetical protein
MNAPQRKRLVTKWFVLATVSILLWVSVSAGMLGRLLVENLWAQNLIEALIRVPGALFWSSLMPQGSMFYQYPPEFVIVVALSLWAIFCVFRLKHHHQRLKAEDRQRDFREL